VEELSKLWAAAPFPSVAPPRRIFYNSCVAHSTKTFTQTLSVNMEVTNTIIQQITRKEDLGVDTKEGQVHMWVKNIQ
jgi:hypothetical protein